MFKPLYFTLILSRINAARILIFSNQPSKYRMQNKIREKILLHLQNKYNPTDSYEQYVFNFYKSNLVKPPLMIKHIGPYGGLNNIDEIINLYKEILKDYCPNKVEDDSIYNGMRENIINNLKFYSKYKTDSCKKNMAENINETYEMNVTNEIDETKVTNEIDEMNVTNEIDEMKVTNEIDDLLILTNKYRNKKKYENTYLVKQKKKKIKKNINDLYSRNMSFHKHIMDRNRNINTSSYSSLYLRNMSLYESMEDDLMENRFKYLYSDLEYLSE